MNMIILKRGNILDAETEAIVNATNTELEKGGGVCGAIFNASGEELILACKNLAPI